MTVVMHADDTAGVLLTTSAAVAFHETTTPFAGGAGAIVMFAAVLASTPNISTTKRMSLAGEKKSVSWFTWKSNMSNRSNSLCCTQTNHGCCNLS